MKKSALLVGINYPGTENQLNGCVNDVNATAAVLEAKGYVTKVLRDAEATRYNILSDLYSLILSDADVLYFHYSGHGSYITDVSGDEADGKDECLVPVDYDTAGMIIDDELRGLLCSLPESKKMTIVLDCCHSGTGVDLAYNAYERVGRYALVKESSAVPTRGKVVCISGCMDSQTSADAKIGGTYQGALTNALLQNLDKSKSWADLINNINKQLRSGQYSQISCLSSGNKIDLKNILWI